MAQAIKRLVYVSAARPLPSAAGLQTILRTARARNAERGVTGLLLYHDGSFFQVLEGSPSDVDEVFARISADSRHGGIIVMSSRTATGRAFGDWSMAFIASTDLSTEQRDGFQSLRARIGADFTPCATTQAFIDSFLGLFREFEAA